MLIFLLVHGNCRRDATYQQIVVNTGDLFIGMNFDISVCKTSVVDEKC